MKQLTKVENSITALQKDGRGVYIVPNQYQPSHSTTAMSAETKAGLIKAGLGLAAFLVAPHVCILALGVYGAAKIEYRRQQYAPKVKTEAAHKMPSNSRIGYQKERKTTEVTQFTHTKTVEEHEFF